MTTGLQVEILLTALRQWPGRWRHAETAIALTESRDTPSLIDLSHAFLADLTHLDTSVTACQRLISLGEFETASQLLAEESLDPAARAALTAERDHAAARRIADLRYRLASLRRRAELAGSCLDLDPIQLEEQAVRSYPPVAAALAEAEQLAVDVERDVRRELWATATAAAAGAGGATQWLDSVRSSLTTGDLTEARRLLADGPSEPDPRTTRGDPVSGLDEHGTALATALRALEDQINEHTVLDFVAALGDLTGAVAPRYEVHNASGGVLVDIRSHWTGLPNWLALPKARGLTLWVAPGDRPPPIKSPLAWVVIQAADISGRLGPLSCARLTSDQLLRLALDEPEPSARLRRLLKLVCSQLDVADVLDPYGRPLPSQDVVDVLDLLGLPTSHALAATLRFETGGRPGLMIELLKTVLAGPGGRTGIGPMTLQEARSAWWPQAFEALLEPYRDDCAGLLLLVAFTFHADQPGSFCLDDLRKGIVAVAADKESAMHLQSIPDLTAATDRLVHDGFFQRHDDGDYSLPDDGVRHLLPLGLDGSGVRRDAEKMAVAVYRRYLADTAERRAEIGALVIRMISHMVSGTMSAIRTELTVIEQARGDELLNSVARVRQYADPGQTLEDHFQRAMRPPEPCALHPLLYSISENQTWRSYGVVRVDLCCPPDLYVMANKWLLGQAFTNMLDNARLAIKDTAKDFGTIRVIATSDDIHCVVDIADSGCGLTDERRHQLQTREAVPSTRGRGVGLLHSRRWFEHYGGSLEIQPENSDLGGSCFRVVLPRCDTTPSEHFLREL